MKVSAKDIATQLAAKCEAFVPWLLPNGKRDSGNWCVGGVGGEAGKSLKVQMAGPKAGVWKDFAGDDEKGDLLDLICAVRGLTLREAIKFAKDYLGIQEVAQVVPKKAWKQPPKVARDFPSGPVLEYLMKQRKLKRETLFAYRIEQSKSKEGAEIVFPSYGPGKDGGLVNRKFLAVARPQGKKISRQESGCAPGLFGWQAIADDAREVVISEGEIDSMTWYQHGFPALSVPMGSGNHQWIDYEWENLEQFDTIWLCYDSTTDGQEGALTAAKRLGTHRCFIVKLVGHKDPNEALMQGKDAKWFSSTMAAARPISPVHIKSPTQFRQKVHDRFHPPNKVPPGYFPEIFNKKLGMRPGEVTIWTGIAGHGKSMLLSQVTLGATLFGMKAAVASMEMKGEATLHKMLCQAGGAADFIPQDIDTMIDWLAGKLWIYDLIGEVRTDLIFELMQYSYARSGVNFFVIDSLMKCGIGTDDYEAQGKFLNGLSTFAKDTNSHVNLVAHARKGRDENNAPGKMDVRGGSDIINQADNILVTWRNKDKEEARHDNTLKPEEEPKIPDAIVYCNKQRETGEEFKQRLMFTKECARFRRMGYDFKTEHNDINIFQRIIDEQFDPQLI